MVKFAVAAVALLLVPFSGCIEAWLGDDDEASSITRTIRFDVNERNIEAAESAATPEEAFSKLARTFFTYTHSGATVQTADVTATFMVLGGDTVERPLSQFTGLSELSDGDRVTVTGAAPYSGLLLTADSLLAQRSGVEAPWYTAGGSPIPLSLSPGAKASWSADAEARQAMSFSGLHAESQDTYTDTACGYDESGYHCDETQYTESFELDVDDVSFSYDVNMDGDIGLAASAAGQDERVELELDGTFDLALLLDSLIRLQTQEDGGTPQSESFPFGFDIALQAQGDALVRQTYDDFGEMKAIGGKGSYSTSGWAKMWDMDHSKEDPMEMLRSSDFPSDSSGYEEEPVDLPQDVDADESAILEAIYGMDLVPGDRFEVTVDVAEDGFRLDLDLDVVVAARENKKVGAGTMDALRIEQSLHLEVDAGTGSKQSIEIQEMTHWVHAKTYLPVLIEADAADWMTTDELEALLRDTVDAMAEFDDDTTIELPDDLGLENSFHGRVELSHLEGDVRVPALFSVFSMWGPMSIVGSAMAFVLVSDLGGGAYGEEWDTAVPSFPNVSVREATEPGWIIMEHLGGDCISTWDYDFRLQGESTAPWQNTEGTATTDMFCVGDKLYLNAKADGQAVEVTVIDSWAQVMVYKRTVQL